jgi:hypothetical protein
MVELSGTGADNGNTTSKEYRETMRDKSGKITAQGQARYMGPNELNNAFQIATELNKKWSPAGLGGMTIEEVNPQAPATQVAASPITPKP